ncbi:MAG: hypothetical protein COB12_04810 [Flavobacterium sp.]|nr:MAG: hypothetical protein COB12_04810 [Flavobacterium sp.]
MCLVIIKKIQYNSGMNKNNFPRYISNKPKGEDGFSGGSHKIIATKVASIIKEDFLETKIIGLEGGWGSGKSNVVKMIEDDLNKENYYTFIFDAWGNQEDLTRKSFLEQIINELFEAKLLNNVEKWKKLEAQLLAKSSKSYKQKFPKIKSHWFFITFSIVLLGVLSGLYENVLLKTDFFELNFKYWKPIISIYLIPFILLVIGVFQIVKEYRINRKANKEKQLKEQETKWDTLGKILYWFSGKEIETEETERIIEEEPSILMFREYFVKIENDIKNNGKLIIVFDNLDRLEAEKVKSLWSSIHTFFAESKDKFKSYVIIPYNQKEMITHFGGKKSGIGFLEKSIPISFRITPPIVTDWENFLDKKIKAAFGTKIIKAADRTILINLFDALIDEKVIMPRKVINYVNDLVTLYLRWEDEVKNGAIKIKYLSLFIFTKEQIIDDPYSTIPSRNYLGSVDTLFQDREELDESMAALTFGVDRKNANEVLLLREFQNNLRLGEAEKLLKSSDHSAFKNYFNKAYYKTDMTVMISGLANILNTLSDKLSPQLLKSYWNDFAKKIVTFTTELESFNDNHKHILLNANKDLSKVVIQKLIETLKLKISEKEEANQTLYYKEIISAEEFIESEESLNLNLKNLLNTVEFNAQPYLEFVEEYPKTFNEYKIDCKEELLESYLFDEEESVNISTLKVYLQEYVKIKKERKFEYKRIRKAIVILFKEHPYNDSDELEKLTVIVKSLFNKPVSLIMSPSFYSQLTVAQLNVNDAYIDSFCIAISDFPQAILQGNFQNTLNTITDEHVKKIYERIEWYIDYGDLIELTTDNVTARAYPKLKDIVYGLTQYKQGNSRLVLDNVLKNFSNIVQYTFDSDDLKESNFIERLAGWEQRFVTKIEDIDIKVFNHFEKENNPLIKKIINKAIEFVTGLSKEDIYSAFSEKGRVFDILKSLVENQLIKSFSSQFYSAFDDYFKNIAKKEESGSDVDFWDDLINLMDARKLKSTFTSVRDILISERGEISENEIHFIEKGLIAYGNLDKNPDGSTLKLIIPMIKYDKTFSLFLNRKKELIKIIDLSEHKETAIGEIETKFRSQKYKDNSSLNEIAKQFGWKNTENEKD